MQNTRRRRGPVRWTTGWRAAIEHVAVEVMPALRITRWQGLACALLVSACGNSTSNPSAVSASPTQEESDAATGASAASSPTPSISATAMGLGLSAAPNETSGPATSPDAATSSSEAPADAAGPPVAAPSYEFRFGVNLGHPNPDFDDSEMSDLAAAVGVRSIRLKYPEYHFANWGQSIEVADAEHYAAVGMRDHVAFLIGMTEAHSMAPLGSQDWERDSYIPKNLYEPIFTDSGEVNPDNFYATYLAETFKTYSPFVKYWEIFNEPDWVSDWSVTQTWDTEPPTAEQLVRFHGSIFDYVRMLRIACEVRDAAAPGTYVLTGGLGYPSFLAALLRYTDNPEGGAVSAEFPKTGAEYFDVLSIHHYPHLVDSGNSDHALESLMASRDAFTTELTRAGVDQKPLMVTETGAAHEEIADTASGAAYARNYLQKSMVWAKAAGFLGMDWFTLSDGTDATDAFSRMGLYQDISALAATQDALPTETGSAYRTTSTLLFGKQFDAELTEELMLPSEVRGYAFTGGGQSVVALWAVGEDESARVAVELPLPGAVELWQWDTETPSELAADDGMIALDVTSDPSLLLWRP